MLDGVIDGGTEFIKAVGLLHALAQDPQVVRRDALTSNAWASTCGGEGLTSGGRGSWRRFA
jgi:hypothetical protein